MVECVFKLTSLTQSCGLLIGRVLWNEYFRGGVGYNVLVWWTLKSREEEAFPVGSSRKGTQAEGPACLKAQRKNTCAVWGMVSPCVPVLWQERRLKDG